MRKSRLAKKVKFTFTPLPDVTKITAESEGLGDLFLNGKEIVIGPFTREEMSEIAHSVEEGREIQLEKDFNQVGEVTLHIKNLRAVSSKEVKGYLKNKK